MVLNYLFNATNHGEAKFNEKWYMMCIDDNKFALFTHVGLTRTYLSFDVNGTVLESRRHIYPDKGDIGTIEILGQLKVFKVLPNLADIGDHFV